MKRNVQFLLITAVAFISTELNAQNGTPYWSTRLNNNAPTEPAMLGTSDSGALGIYTTNVERIRITNAGNVGIGTTSPLAKLQVVVPSGVSPLRATIGGSTKFMVHPNGSLSIGSTSQGTTNGLFVNGFAGFGTAAPTERLHVIGNQVLSGTLRFPSDQHSIQFSNPGTASKPMMYLFQSGTTNQNRMVIGHSPSFPTWGLQYIDATDQFSFVGSGSSKMSINLANGNVGIGTTSPSYRLSVNGTIQAKEVRVESGWADFVFDKDYELIPLNEVEKYINLHHHLPGISSAKEVQEKGLPLAEMQTKMMAKVEELTLYVIMLQKKIDKLEKEKVSTTNNRK